jgi:hypothetical protein
VAGRVTYAAAIRRHQMPSIVGQPILKGATDQPVKMA